jgi:hypothetical protein
MSTVALMVAEGVLRAQEDVVPQARFEVALELREIEERTDAAAHQLLRVVEEIEPEVDEGAGRDLAVDDQVFLGKVPAARPDEEDRRLLLERVLLPVRGLERDRSADRVIEILLAVDEVRPRGRRRVLEVGHEHVGAGVQRVDDHLAVDRAGDLDAAIEQHLGHGRARPVAGAYVGGLGEEVGELAAVELSLSLGTLGEELFHARPERAHEIGDEFERFRRQDERLARASGGPRIVGRALHEDGLSGRDRRDGAAGRRLVMHRGIQLAVAAVISQHQL